MVSLKFWALIAMTSMLLRCLCVKSKCFWPLLLQRTWSCFILILQVHDEVIYCNSPRDVDIDMVLLAFGSSMLLLRVQDLLLCVGINPALNQLLVLDLCQLVLVALYGCIIVRLTIRCCSARMSTIFCYHLLARHWLTPLLCILGPDLRAR